MKTQANLTIKKTDKTNALKEAQNMYPIIATLAQFLIAFYYIIDNSDIAALDSFIDKYSNCDIDSLSQFAKGLAKDYDAVKNCLIYPNVSNGATEARNGITKMRHRDCRGRAKLELLQAYILLRQDRIA